MRESILVARSTLGGLRIAWFSRTDNAEASRKYVIHPQVLIHLR